MLHAWERKNRELKREPERTGHIFFGSEDKWGMDRERKLKGEREREKEKKNRRACKREVETKMTH